TWRRKIAWAQVARPGFLRARRSAEGAQILEELVGAALPGKTLGVAPAVGGRDLEAVERGAAEIGIEAADRSTVDDVERPRHRIGGDRQARGQRLEHHQAEGVGPAREDEDVGGGVVARQVLAMSRAGEARRRI